MNLFAQFEVPVHLFFLLIVKYILLLVSCLFLTNITTRDS